MKNYIPQILALHCLLYLEILNNFLFSLLVFVRNGWNLYWREVVACNYSLRSCEILKFSRWWSPAILSEIEANKLTKNVLRLKKKTFYWLLKIRLHPNYLCKCPFYMWQCKHNLKNLKLLKKKKESTYTSRIDETFWA